MSTRCGVAAGKGGVGPVVVAAWAVWETAITAGAVGTGRAAGVTTELLNMLLPWLRQMLRATSALSQSAIPPTLWSQYKHHSHFIKNLKICRHMKNVYLNVPNSPGIMLFLKFYICPSMF